MLPSWATLWVYITLFESSSLPLSGDERMFIWSRRCWASSAMKSPYRAVLAISDDGAPRYRYEYSHWPRRRTALAWDCDMHCDELSGLQGRGLEWQSRDERLSK